jgi:uncharacterized protein YbjT (DUF2867 family)
LKVLLVGANGLIANAVGARLSAIGHEVWGSVRPGTAGEPPLWMSRRFMIDAQAPAEAWMPAVSGVDAVVNCMGALQSSSRDGDIDAVHVRGAGALFSACEAAGVRRLIHFSAIGVDRHQLSAFSQTKLAGERLLMETGLDWIILRPAVVLGRPVYGASAQFRGLSALPVNLAIPEAGALQVVQLDDVVETVGALLERPDLSCRAYDLAGPERLAFHDVVEAYRRWHGWRPARQLQMPKALMKLAFAAGDAAGWLGWRPALRTNAAQELVAGAVGDNGPWRTDLGIDPAALSQSLRREPVTVQDRWFAKLYFLKALALIVFALFWIGTGLISIGPGYGIGVEHMLEGGAGAWSGPVVIAGGLADIAIGLMIAFRRTTRLGLLAALGISIAYAVIGTIILPQLWIEPLGPMLKIWPIVALNLLLLAILDER